jgi:YtkA-like
MQRRPLAAGLPRMGFRLPRRGLWAGLAIAVLSGVAALAATATSPTRHQLLGELQRAAQPARTATAFRPARTATAFSTRGRVAGVALTLALTPNRDHGPNQVWVRISRGGRPLTGARVTVAFSMPSMNMWNVYRASLAPAGAGRYLATVPVLGMAGRWRLGVGVVPSRGRSVRLAVTDRLGA